MNNLSGLKPIKLLPARERVASALRKVILTKELPAGTVITLEGIASQLEVSITPVREAFLILNREGLILQHHNRGAEVLAPSRKFIQDHYETRALLEGECAAAICRNGADTSEIENVYNNSVKDWAVEDFSKFSNYNQAFHFAIWEAAGNEKMKTLLSEMWNGFSLGHRVTEEEYAIKSVTEHKDIIAAILAKDETLAKKLMSAHIIRSMNDVLTNHQ